MTAPVGNRVVLGCDVLGELSFSFCTRILAAASAVVLPFVEDDPDGFSVFVGWSEPQSGREGFTRHRSIILRISARFVMSFPAIRQTINRPRAASLRRLERPIE